MQETILGFSRGEVDYIQLILHDHDQVSCHIELPVPPTGWWSRLTGNPTVLEEELRSRDEVVRVVSEYFNVPENELLRRLKARRR